MIHHFVLGFCDLSHKVWESPLRILISGYFAVQVFFVLSGFVLSISFFRSLDQGVLVSAALRRYFRLMLPVLSSLVFAWILQSTVGFHHRAAADLMGQAPDSWFHRGAEYLLSFKESVIQGVYETFFAYTGKRSLNTSLWTMSIELYCSMFVFGFLALCGKLSRRYLIYAILFLLLRKVNENMMTFLFGVMLCDFYIVAQRKNKPFRLPWWQASSVILFGLFLGGTPLGWMTEHLGFAFPATKDWPRFGAFLLLVGVVGSPILQRFLQLRPLVWLGKVSFSVYLLYWPILVSIISSLYIQLRNHGWEHRGAIWLLFGIYFLLTMILAQFFSRYVDEQSIRFARWAEGWFTGNRRLLGSIPKP